jgi:hypothetical protein
MSKSLGVSALLLEIMPKEKKNGFQKLVGVEAHLLHDLALQACSQNFCCTYTAALIDEIPD